MQNRRCNRQKYKLTIVTIGSNQEVEFAYILVYFVRAKHSMNYISEVLHKAVQVSMYH